ncbi:MAG TPA: SURF1 family protein [Aquabacterium sp.]|nr:SURF1 family protein [Aquabacterium sp.]
MLDLSSKRNARLVVFTAAVLACGTTARLGFWQLDRARQKQQIAADMHARRALPPLPAEALARDAAGLAAQRYRSITLRGHWLPGHTVYLDNRQMDGRPGFFVVTPLRLPGGDAVLVQRGWLQRNFQERERLAPIATPAGEVTVAGRIVPPPSALFPLGGAGSGLIRQNLPLDEFARETGLRLRPLSIQQQDGEPGAPDPLQRRWPEPQVDVGKHHGYAFQWFALSVLVAGLYVWFQIIQPIRRRRAA